MEYKPPQITQQEQEAYQCIICYELPIQPTFTQCCNQILCLKHKNSLSNKCPNCRQSPFQTKQNVEIEKQITCILQRDMQEYQRKLKIIKEIEMIQCKFCLEVPQKPIITLCCKKIQCYKHTIQMKSECSICKTQPVKFKEDKYLSNEVINYKIKQILNEKQKLACKVKGCNFYDNFEILQQHYKEQHQTEINKDFIKSTIESQELKDVVKYKLERGTQIRKERLMRELYVQHLRETRQPSYGKKKIASVDQRLQMREHANTCHHEGCKQLWSGSWGPFIGGDQGKTHFDLTECQIGKQLNLNIGWNYDDPAN